MADLIQVSGKTKKGFSDQMKLAQGVLLYKKRRQGHAHELQIFKQRTHDVKILRGSLQPAIATKYGASLRAGTARFQEGTLHSGAPTWCTEAWATANCPHGQ